MVSKFTGDRGDNSDRGDSPVAATRLNRMRAGEPNAQHLVFMNQLSHLRHTDRYRG